MDRMDRNGRILVVALSIFTALMFVFAVDQWFF